MYFICKAVDMAPQPIRCLWSGDNKHLKKNKKQKNKKTKNKQTTAHQQCEQFVISIPVQTISQILKALTTNQNY